MTRKPHSTQEMYISFTLSMLAWLKVALSQLLFTHVTSVHDMRTPYYLACPQRNVITHVPSTRSDVSRLPVSLRPEVSWDPEWCSAIGGVMWRSLFSVLVAAAYTYTCTRPSTLCAYTRTLHSLDCAFHSFDATTASLVTVVIAWEVSAFALLQRTGL